MYQEKQLTEIKVKVTNTSEEQIDNVEVFSPNPFNDGITISSLTQGVSYDSLLGSLMNIPTTKFEIETAGVGDHKSNAFIPFRLHTVNITKGDYNGKGYAPAIKGESKESWLSPKPVKWGGKNRYTKLILEYLPANSSVIIILKVYEEKEPMTAPKGCENYFLNHEEIVKTKTTLMKVAEAVEKIKADKPKEIFSLNYSNSKPFLTIKDYDDEENGALIFCSAWGKDKPESFYEYEDIYKLLKREGLKSIVY